MANFYKVKIILKFQILTNYKSASVSLSFSDYFESYPVIYYPFFIKVTKKYFSNIVQLITHTPPAVVFNFCTLILFKVNEAAASPSVLNYIKVHICTYG